MEEKRYVFAEWNQEGSVGFESQSVEILAF